MTEAMIRGDGDEVLRAEVEKFRAKVLVILTEAQDQPLPTEYAARRITEAGRALMLLGFAAGHGRCWQDYVMTADGERHV